MREGKIDERADGFLIVNHKNASRSMHRLGDRPGLLGNRQLLVGGRGQINGESGSLMQDRGDGDEPVVVLDDRVSRGQAKTCALRLGGKVGIEDALEIIFGDAGAFVVNGDANVFAGCEVGDGLASGGTVIIVIAGDAQGAAVRHGLIRVHHQIGDDLADLSGVNLGRQEVCPKGKFAPAMAAAQGEADRVLNQFADGSSLFNGGAATGEGEELLGEIARAHGGVLGVRQPRGQFVVGREEQGGQRDVADNGGQQVVKIVSDSAGQESELLEGLGFAPLRFVALTLGDIPENEDHARDFVFVVANRGGNLLDDIFGAAL